MTFASLKPYFVMLMVLESYTSKHIYLVCRNKNNYVQLTINYKYNSIVRKYQS